MFLEAQPRRWQLRAACKACFACLAAAHRGEAVLSTCPVRQDRLVFWGRWNGKNLGVGAVLLMGTGAGGGINLQ